MKPIYLLRPAALVAILIAAGSCIYPFHPDVKGSDSRLVIEGSIVAGSTSVFKFSAVHPIGTPQTNSTTLSFTGYIEGEDGTRIRPSDAQDGASLHFDTADLPEGQRYRIHFEDTRSQRIYESDWVEVCSAPVIDDLSYILDKNRGELDVALSMHCQGQHYFRWSYTETWEYTANRRATHYFDVQAAELHPYRIRSGDVLRSSVVIAFADDRSETFAECLQLSLCHSAPPCPLRSLP